MLNFIVMLLCFLSVGVVSVGILLSIIGVELMTQINLEDLSK